MDSPYRSRVEEYGRAWYRPWVVVLTMLALCVGMRWLNYEEADEPQVICTPKPGSRWQAAVDVQGLLWTGDLDAALACAFTNDRWVLIEFHNVTNTNAKINDLTVFRERKVRSAMKKYVLARLYTDYVPHEYYIKTPTDEENRNDANTNKKFEHERFDTLQIPYYAVCRPTGVGRFVVVGVYDEGRINDSERFVAFLHDPKQRGSSFWEGVRLKVRGLIEK